MLGLSDCMTPGSPGFIFFSLTNGELTWGGDGDEALYARGLKGHTWETALRCVYCLHELLDRIKIILCCLLTPAVACG